MIDCETFRRLLCYTTNTLKLLILYFYSLRKFAFRA